MDDFELLEFCQQKLQTGALRPGQGDVIRTLQRKKSCLAIMPTGGGKSLLWLLSTYIHNRQFRSGVGHKPLTLVIVPYKALVMSHLRDSGSWLCCLSSENEVSHILTNIEGCNLIYSTPEKIVKKLAFQHMLVQNAHRIKLIAIDEAHLLLEHACFRTDLCACIALLQLQIPNAVRLAVSATSRIAYSEILLQAAKMPSDSNIVRCSLDRSNCYISISPQLDTKDQKKLTKFERDHISIFQLVNKPSKPKAIVFVGSKKEAENMAEHLQQLCMPNSTNYLNKSEIAYFHADLSPEMKQQVITGFDGQDIFVVVATSAFGTGMNFPSIRYIIHYSLPSSLTEYMQNIGRGGRDGQKYHCLLYFSYKNIHEQGCTWMYGTTIEELPHKWKKFVEMIQFVFSTKCRRAFILPYFDSSYNASVGCNSCDSCALADEAMPQIDIQSVARIILKVIREFQSSYDDGVIFTRVKDVITCHTRIHESDSRLMTRGIGAKSGFPVRNKAVWSIAINYLLYGDVPLVAEKVIGVGSSSSKPYLLRKLVLTEAGTSWLDSSSQETQFLIRHPVELLHCKHADVQAQFCPDRSVSAHPGTPPASGLAKVTELTRRPWVRFVQPAGTAAMGDFQLVFCQLEEQKVLAFEVSKAHAGQRSKTTAFFFEDVTYAYSDHFAMTIMTESLVTGRGAVVAFVLMTRLHTEAYAKAFYTFLDQNECVWHVNREKQCIELHFVLVVDHADSQRKGFVEAVRMLHAAKMLGASWTADLAQSYLVHLQGCEFHYQSSVKNAAQNGNIIPANKSLFFKECCNEMLKVQSMEEFKTVEIKIRGHFPKVVKWLKWWVNPLHAVLIFPAFMKDLRCCIKIYKSLPKTPKQQTCAKVSTATITDI